MMDKILTIAKKELDGYFKTPSAYIILVITYIVFNIFFYMIINENREATLRDVFKVMEFMFIFIVPLLTMKIFAEEKANGTMEFLMTTPTSNMAIVLGKYLGAVVFFSIIVSINVLYYFLIEFFASPDRATFLTGFLGVWLEGVFFLSIGLLMSSLTRHQVIAAVSTYIMLFLLYFSLSFVQYTSGRLETFVRYFSTMSHAENLSQGLIHLSDIVYFLSGIVFCVLLTRVSIEARK